MTTNKQMMGFEVPGDERVPVTLRDWNAMKLALWRSKQLWEIAEREALLIVQGCAHMSGCPATDVETEVCLQDCPDRERRISALVILNAGRTLAPIDAKKAAEMPYFAPSREYYSEILATLRAHETEVERLTMATANTPLPPKEI